MLRDHPRPSPESVAGGNIRDFRKKRKPKLTQEALAGKAGLTRNYIARVERGEAKASKECLDKIARVLKVDTYMLCMYYPEPLTEEERTLHELYCGVLELEIIRALPADPIERDAALAEEHLIYPDPTRPGHYVTPFYY